VLGRANRARRQPAAPRQRLRISPDHAARQPRSACLAATGNEQISTIDLIGPRFLLLAGPKGDAWRHAAKKGELVLPGEEAMSFVPISLADDRVEKSAEKSGFGADVIEIEVAGAVVRARSGIDLGFLSSVLRAIRLSI